VKNVFVIQLMLQLFVFLAVKSKNHFVAGLLEMIFVDGCFPKEITMQHVLHTI
jgi:hypothetical protein